MRLRTKLLVTLVPLFFVGAFFFAPAMYWFSTGPYYEAYPHPSSNVTPVYRYLGCLTVGYGVSYGPDWFGYVLGCGPSDWTWP